MLDQRTADELTAQIKAERERLTPPSDDSTNNEVNESVDTSSHDEDPYLAEALKMGYDPKYNGPNRKSPEQFVKDGSFFKKIESQKREIEDIKKQLKAWADHSAKVERAAREKVLKEIEAEKLAAVRDADMDAYNKAELRGQEVQKELNDIKPPEPSKPEQPTELKEFLDRNKDWCNMASPENTLMAKAADGLCEVIAEEARIKGESITLAEQLKRVEARIKVLFPSRFENLNQKKPAIVAESTTATGGKTTSIASRLSERQRRMYDEAKAYGATLTLEQYAKQLQLTGDLRDE